MEEKVVQRRSSLGRRRSLSRSRSRSDSGERCRSIVMVNSDDLEQELNYSDCEDNFMEAEVPKKEKRQRKKKQPARMFK